MKGRLSQSLDATHRFVSATRARVVRLREQRAAGLSTLAKLVLVACYLGSRLAAHNDARHFCARAESGRPLKRRGRAPHAKASAFCGDAWAAGGPADAVFSKRRCDWRHPDRSRSIASWPSPRRLRGSSSTLIPCSLESRAWLGSTPSFSRRYAPCLPRWTATARGLLSGRSGLESDVGRAHRARGHRSARRSSHSPRCRGSRDRRPCWRARAQARRMAATVALAHGDRSGVLYGVVDLLPGDARPLAVLALAESAPDGGACSRRLVLQDGDVRGSASRDSGHERSRAVLPASLTVLHFSRAMSAVGTIRCRLLAPSHSRGWTRAASSTSHWRRWPSSR